jgi:hypothetical protein
MRPCYTTMAAFRQNMSGYFSRVPDETGRLGSLLDELRSHNNDGSCFLLFKSLLCPTEILKHYISLVDRALQTEHRDGFYYFQLIPRGSVARGTVLRCDVDIDLDLVLPMTLFHISERANVDPGEEVLAPLIQEWNTLLPEVFSRIQLSGDGPHTFCGVQLLQLGGEITRSIKCELVVDAHSAPVRVDLFPKYISSDGRMMGLGPARADGTRTVLYQDPLARPKGVEFTDEELAAVVFLKLWKKQRQ